MQKKLKGWISQILKKSEAAQESDFDVTQLVTPPALNQGVSDGHYKTLNICVTTTCLNTGKTSERIIDHNNSEQRRWLGRHCHWAFRNQHSITTTPL